MLVAPKVFKLAKLAAKEASRYAINSVLFERDSKGRCVAAATDGRRLGIVEWDDRAMAKEFPPINGSKAAVLPKGGFSCMIPAAACTAIAKTIPSKTPKEILRHALIEEATANGKVTVITTDLSTTNQSAYDTTTEARFPKYQDLIPKYVPGMDSVRISVDPKLMIGVLEAAAEFCSEERKAVLLEIPFSPSKPIGVTAKDDVGHKATFVLMPHGLDGVVPGPDTPALHMALRDALTVLQGGTLDEAGRNELTDRITELLEGKKPKK